jgi:putative oxidoreductase
MRFLSLSALGSMRGLAPLVLRLVTGLIMFMHGWNKFQGGMDGVAGFFGSLGIAAPEVMAYVVTTIELVGGILLILGLFTRLSAVAVVLVLIGVLFTAKSGGVITGGDKTMELEMSLAAAAIALALLGPGKLSIDHRLGLTSE